MPCAPPDPFSWERGWSSDMAVAKMAATPARHKPVPAAPVKSSFFRSSRSITLMAMQVNIKLVNPIETACMSLEILLNPARSKMSLR